LSPPLELPAQQPIGWLSHLNFTEWSRVIMPADLFSDLDHPNSHQPLAKIGYWLLLVLRSQRFVMPLAKVLSCTDAKAIKESV
jgi:hypothetical protein